MMNRVYKTVFKNEILSEIETTVKRASKAAGFSWGEAEEIGKCKTIRDVYLMALNI